MFLGMLALVELPGLIGLGLDLRILWRTAGRVLGRRGVAAAGEATMPAFRGSAPEAREPF